MTCKRIVKEEKVEKSEQKPVASFFATMKPESIEGEWKEEERNEIPIA